VNHSEAIGLIKKHLIQPLPDDSLLIEVKRHIGQCTICKGSLGSKVIALVGDSQSILTGSIDLLTCEQCSDLLPEYAEFSSDDAKERYPSVWRHLQVCSACNEVYAHLHQIAIDEERGLLEAFSREPTFEARQEKRRDKNLMAKYDEIVKRNPSSMKNSLVKIRSDIEALFKVTFTHPTPRFSPVFGEHQAAVLSPFGKVRYPIIFEWTSLEDADEYYIGIEEATWSRTTTQTKIAASPEDLRLDYGEEYMWKLRFLKNGKAIDEITGFFSLISEQESEELKEIGKQIEVVEPGADRLILLGSVLEKKELYIEAIGKYKEVYVLQPSSGIAYRIASCYDHLELEGLRDEWNTRIR